MIRFPLVTRLATPVITNDIARVAMSELMRKNVAITPLTAPTPTPTSTPTRMARTGLPPSAILVAITWQRA